jgi:hypothetical protein
MPEKYEHIDFKPPAGVRAEAKKGLEWRDEHNRGGTMVGVARARDLSNGKNISADTAKRMNSYFARHAVDKKGKGWSPGEDGFPSAGRIAWALWGGDAGEAWAGKLVRQIEAADKKERSLPVKPKQIKSWKSDELPPQKMILRMVSVRAETANAETKSVEVVVASENPIERYDSERDSVIREILLMDGVEFRTDRMQLPIVDSHDRSTVRNVLGSVRNIRKEGTQLVGDATFARDSDSQSAYEKLLDGHLTDFSITATPKQITSVRRGETYSLRGEIIEGPADIVTRWMPTDASLVAAGADETSTVRDLRRSYFINGDDLMKRALTEEMKAMLVAKGMPEQIEDPEQALTWVVGMMTEAAGESPEIEMENKPMENAMAAEDEMKKMEHPEKKMAEGMDQEEEIKQTVQRALKEDSKRRKEIVALCSAANIERSFAEQLCDTGVSLDIARTQILEKVLMTNQPLGASSGRERIEVTRSSDDKFNEAIRDGLISRAFRGAGLRTSPFAGGKPAEGSEEFKHFGLMRMAEKILQRQGVNTDRMSNRDIALAALGSPAVCNRFNIERSSYHTTGSFSNLLLDAANKTLLTAYDEAPTTYQLWSRTAPAVADFKTVNRIRFSEAPDLEVVPETKPYKQGVMTDSKESYKVEKYGAIFTVSWETVVNDDLDAISRIPAMHGNAARRKVNKVVYNVLTSNPTMGDGFSLFSASHASGTNFANASAAPSVTTLNTAFRDMMKQKGLTSDAIINVNPRYLIVPVSVAAGALQLVGSLADPAAGGSSTTGNSNTLNIYGPNGVRPLQVIVEPVLEAYSTTGWFLAADYASVDTVEVSFLQGEESPVLENEWDFNTDCYKYKVRQTFGVAAIDWRGLYKYHNA